MEEAAFLYLYIASRSQDLYTDNYVFIKTYKRHVGQLRNFTACRKSVASTERQLTNRCANTHTHTHSRIYIFLD